MDKQEAIKILKEFHDKSALFSVRTALETVLPELKEDEDELEWLKQFIQEEAYSLSMDIRDDEDRIKLKKLQRSLAWLKKQGENNKWKPSKDEMDALYSLSYLTNKVDDEKDEAITKLYQDLKREFFGGKSYENMFPTNTSTEDDVRRRSTIQVLEYARNLDTYNQYGKEDITKNIAWLEKQGKTITVDIDKMVDEFAHTEVKGYGTPSMIEVAAYRKGINDTLCLSLKLEKQGEQKAINQYDIEIPFGAKDSELIEESYYIPKGYHAEISKDKVTIKKGEQKLAWSAEDMFKVQRICKYLCEAKKYYADISEVRDCIDWLHSLKQRIGG